jgi:hypothetical protein
LRRTLLAGIGAALVSVCAVPRAKAVPLVGRPRGRPKIKLDRVTLPAGTANAEATLRHLKFFLRREARRADWGTGARSTIAFRFTVETLAIESRPNSLHVRCSALGELPRRRTARSQLSYGGDPKLGSKLVIQVLEIVARGVISRLADMERTRRSA